MGAVVAAALCVAGVVLGDIDLRFAWQAWHLATETFVLRGRRGTYGTGLVLVTRLVCVAGVALGDIDLRFAWQAWHLATETFVLRGRRGTYSTGLVLVSRLGPGGRRGRRGTLRGRRGTWQHRPSFCVAGMALGHIDRHFVSYGTGLALVTRLVPVCRCPRGRLRGRRGTW